MKVLRKLYTGRIFFFFSAIALLLAVLVMACLSLGNIFISPSLMFKSLLSGRQDIIRVLLYVRIPRMAGAAVAGSSLAAAGYIIQTVLSNPLASPGIIGANSSAGFFVALLFAAFPKAVKIVPAAAFLGALAGVLLVVFISERTGASKITLVLSGIVVSMVFGAAIDAVITFVPDSLTSYNDFRIGSVANISMNRVWPALAISSICIIISAFMTNHLDILMLGRDTACSLGINVKAARIVLLVISAALAGSAVSIAGIISSVGLIVPHIMRRIVGNEGRFMLPSCVLGGACFLMLCDLLARTLFVPYEIPVGIILSLLGGPFFIFLLIMQRKGRRHD